MALRQRTCRWCDLPLEHWAQKKTNRCEHCDQVCVNFSTCPRCVLVNQRADHRSPA